MKKKWIIFTVLALGYILVYFHRLCTAVVATDMKADLEISGTLLGLLGAAYFYPYALMQLPAGLLSDTWGPRKTITTFFIIAGIGSFILGISETFYIALLGRTLVGIGVAMLFVPTLKVLSVWFHAKSFSGVTGLLIAMGGVGTLIATSPLAFLNNKIGWRNSFILIGGITLIASLLVWLIVKDKPEDDNHNHNNDLKKYSLKESVKIVLSSKSFWVLAIWFFFNSGIFFSFGALWAGPYLKQVYGYSNLESGFILSMFAFGMILGSPTLGLVSNNPKLGRKGVIIICAVSSLIILLIFYFNVASIGKPFLFILFFAMGVFTNAIVAIGFTASKELFSIKIAGTSTGLVNFFPFAGGAVAQPIIGYIMEKTGKTGIMYSHGAYENMFLFLIVFSSIAFIASLKIEETLTS